VGSIGHPGYCFLVCCGSHSSLLSCPISSPPSPFPFPSCCCCWPPCHCFPWCWITGVICPCPPCCQFHPLSPLFYWPQPSPLSLYRHCWSTPLPAVVLGAPLSLSSHCPCHHPHPCCHLALPIPVSLSHYLDVIVVVRPLPVILLPLLTHGGGGGGGGGGGFLLLLLLPLLCCSQWWLAILPIPVPILVLLLLPFPPCKQLLMAVAGGAVVVGICKGESIDTLYGLVDSRGSWGSHLCDTWSHIARDQTCTSRAHYRAYYYSYLCEVLNHHPPLLQIFEYNYSLLLWGNTPTLEL
jgi:hypothetical protein